MPRTLCATLAVLGTVAVLAGCGGEEPAPVTDRDATLRLTLTEYRIQPQSVRIQATRRPMPVRIVARNRGILTHNVKVESISRASAQGTDRQPTVFGGTDHTAQPGETVTGTVYLQPGTYRLTCTIANHDNLGQYGTLIVEAPR
jgi:plastocyanin